MIQYPFTIAQFLDVFSRYNQAVWPAPLILYMLAVAALVCIIVKTRSSDRMVFEVLCFFWLWVGLVYHIFFFSSINQAAYMFGILFIGQAVVLWYYGIMKGATGFHVSRDGLSIAGLAFIAYSLVLYPVIGTFTGQPYPYLPVLGVPCPITIFTFGIFLCADRRVPLYLIAIPLLWSGVGFVAALSFGIVEDYGLVIAGVLGTLLVSLKNRRYHDGK